MDYLLKLLPAMLKGTGMTLAIFAITLILSLPLGLLVSLLRVSRNRVVAKIVEIYCWIMRGTPLLLQLMFVYYGLPVISPSLTMPAFPCAIIAFTLNYTAYFVEIFRGGIQSIEHGQLEAADVLGMSRYQTMRRIVLPQAIKRVLPSLGNEVITLVKDTALVYTISIHELLRVTQIAATRDFRSEAFIVAGVIYLLLTFVCTRLQRRVEDKFAYYR
ncbi:MAG: amino acid ABC transporter permease [Christensenellales bacterium]